MLEYIGLKLFFYDIRKLHARMGEKFHPIVLKWVMRCRDDHTGLKIILAHEAGHARSGNHTGKCGRGAGLNQTGLITFIVLFLLCFPLCWIPFIVDSMKGDPAVTE